jgi:hypothetical protein
MNNENVNAMVEQKSDETETPRLTIEVPTELKAGQRPWLPPCSCQGCCAGGGCADGS